jgi:serine/threonine protein kinase
MSDHPGERIEGLEPTRLFRAALGDADLDPDAVERAAEEERRVRAEIERRLPDLELLELLGRGGMGYVYRARQKQLDRVVALKVVAPDAGTQADFAERFAREAQALARLNHPNLVTVYDYGQDGPFGWLIMEYVDGSNLRDLIRAGRLEPAEALALVPKICDALQFAHDQGVVHRDVKPENILLDRHGQVKIADFGLAKLVGTPAAVIALTGSQQVLGTLRYMAPEQLERPLEVDHRADIYSLGVVFYEMLTGEIPMGRFDPPSRCSAASAALDDVVLHALAKEPGRRYQRASEVKSDLESVERGERAPLAAAHGEPAQREHAPGDSGTVRGGSSTSASPRMGSESSSSAAAPKSAEAVPGLSGRAVVSVALLATGFLVFMPTLIMIARTAVGQRAGAMSGAATGVWDFQPSMAHVFGIATGVLGLGLMIIGGAQGHKALEQIRAAWPRLQGAGVAVVGAWGGVLFVSNLVVLSVLLASETEDTPTPLMIVVTVLVAIDATLLRSYWRRFVDSCRTEQE